MVNIDLDDEGLSVVKCFGPTVVANFGPACMSAGFGGAVAVLAGA